MKGNQGPRGAYSKRAGKKAHPKKGTGGHGRRALAGRGPTPKAEERTYHPAYKEKKKREARASQAAAKERRQQETAVRVREGNELVVGRNPVTEAARGGIKVETVYLAADPASAGMRAAVEALAETGAPFVEVGRRDLDRVSDGSAHQGIAIEVKGYDYWSLEDLTYRATEKVTPGLLVALDHVTDPHNVGAVLRSAAAFGADGLILPERRSAGVGVTAWKVSAGAAAVVPAARVTNLVQSLRRLKESGFFVVGLDGNADESVRNMTLATEPLVVVIGAEGAGLSRLVRETCDMVVSIPTTGNVESLNAAVAAGITLYEVYQARLEAN